MPAGLCKWSHYNNIRDDNVDCGEDHPDITLAAMNNDVAFGGVPLFCFETVSELDVARLVTSVPVKSCELDPIPTWLVKRCSAELVPVITVMINASLTPSHVRADFKHAIVKPLLKKTYVGQRHFEQLSTCVELAIYIKIG